MREREKEGNEIENNNSNNNIEQTSLSVSLALKLMKFVVCIFNGINLVMSLQQNEPIKWICAFFITRLFPPHASPSSSLVLFLLLLLLFISPTARVFYLHMRKFIVFLCDIQIVSSYKLTTLKSNLFSAILSTRL